MELVSTKFTNLVPLEQFHHKRMVMYDGGLLKARVKMERFVQCDHLKLALGEK